MTFLQPKVPFWFFLCACWNPYFCSVWWFCMVTQKGDIFHKQTVATKMRAFSTFGTQIVFAYFQKWHFNKKYLFFTTTKNNLFLGFPFPFFHFFSFAFSNKTRQKQKMLFFVENPFLTPQQPAQINIFAPLHTICDFKLPPKHFGKTSKKSWTDFDSTLARFLTQTRPDFWQIFDSLYIYIYAVKLLSGPSLAILGVIIWAK